MKGAFLLLITLSNSVRLYTWIYHLCWAFYSFTFLSSWLWFAISFIIIDHPFLYRNLRGKKQCLYNCERVCGAAHATTSKFIRNNINVWYLYWKGWKQTFEGGRPFSYVRVFLHFSDDGFYKYSPGDQVAAAGRSTIPTTLATVLGLEVEHVDSTSTGLFQEWFWDCERLEDNTLTNHSCHQKWSSPITNLLQLLTAKASQLVAVWLGYMAPFCIEVEQLISECHVKQRIQCHSKPSSRSTFVGQYQNQSSIKLRPQCWDKDAASVGRGFASEENIADVQQAKTPCYSSINHSEDSTRVTYILTVLSKKVPWTWSNIKLALQVRPPRRIAIHATPPPKMEPRQREAYLRKLDHNGTWIMCMLRMDDLCFHSWWYVNIYIYILWISRPLTRHFWGSAMERQTQATPPFHLCNFIQREGSAGGLWPFVPKISQRILHWLVLLHVTN